MRRPSSIFTEEETYANMSRAGSAPKEEEPSREVVKPEALESSSSIPTPSESPNSQTSLSEDEQRIEREFYRSLRSLHRQDQNYRRQMEES